MASSKRWYFTKEQIMNSPSRRNGIDFDREMSNRQQAANLIQDMGQTLQVNQLCINTAIVYMHRFYMFHSFAQFHRNSIAACAIFLAAKVEEQPRKLDHVVKVAYRLTNRDQPNLETKSEIYNELANKLVTHENILLQTLGFDAVIDHPHTYVVKCCQNVRASKDLAQTSYFMATNSLHLTTMCLQYSPQIVACVCIHIVTKWSSIQIPPSHEGKNWWYYIDKGVTLETLEALTAEFLEIFNKCPARLKNRIKSGTQGVAGSPFPTGQTTSAPSQQMAIPKKPEVPTQKPQVPVDDHAAQSLVQKDRGGQPIPSHAQQRLTKPPIPPPSIHPHQRQMNGTKPTPQLAKHPTVAPPTAVASQQSFSRVHNQPVPQVHQQTAPMQVKTQPVLPRSKTYAGSSLSQPLPAHTEQSLMPDLHQVTPAKRPEMLSKHDQRPQLRPDQVQPRPEQAQPRPDQTQPRPDPTARLQSQSQPIVRSEHNLPRRDGQSLSQHSLPRPTEPQRPPSHLKPEPVRPDLTKRVVAVKSEPMREAPAPPPPLPKSKPPEPPQPPSIFGGHNVPALNQNLTQVPFSSGILGDFPLIEHEVVDTNWDLDFGGLSPPFSALLGEKKPEAPKAMPSLFSPEDDSSKRTEPPPPVQTVQFEKTIEQNKQIVRETVQTIGAVTEVKTEVVNKKIKEVTNIELREVKKEKPVYSTIDTKEHENLFSTLMENPATSIFGIPKIEKSPEKSIFSLPKIEKSPEKVKPPTPPPVQRPRTTSTTEPSICLKKVDQEYNSLKDGSRSVTLPSFVPEVSEYQEIKMAVSVKPEPKPVEAIVVKPEQKTESKTESHEKDDKHHKKKKKKEHKKHKHKESDESRKDRKKHKKEKDRSKEKSREEETPKKIKIKVGEEKPKSPEKKDIPKLKIKAPKPPSPRPEPPPELPKAPEVKISGGDGLKLKIKMNNPPEVSRKRDRSPGTSGESSSKSRKLENGEHDRKKEKKDKHKEHKSHKKDSSRDKDRESSSKHRSSDSSGLTL